MNTTHPITFDTIRQWLDGSYYVLGPENAYIWYRPEWGSSRWGLTLKEHQDKIAHEQREAERPPRRIGIVASGELKIEVKNSFLRQWRTINSKEELINYLNNT